MRLSWIAIAVLTLSWVLEARPALSQVNDVKVCRERRGADALAACSRLIDLGKSTGLTLYLHYNDRGGAHQSLGDHQRAIEDFSKAISLDRNLPYSFINRGVSWAKLGAFDRAISDFAEALRIDPKNARAYNNRGGAHRDRGEFELAIADFNRAIALDPKLADALFNRGTVHMQRAEFDQAIADYTTVIQQNPKDILAFAARGQVWSSKKDDKRAQVDFESALAVPATDQQSKEVKEAVRELLRGLLEKRAALKKAALEKEALEKQAAQEKQAALEREKKSVAPPIPAPNLRPSDRLALVMGNGAYVDDLGRLGNPTNDATDVAKALQDLGFKVTLGLDLGHAEMRSMIANFARAVRDAETAVVFFAGHGFQYGGVNYLAPIDAPITDEQSIAKHVSLDSVMADLKAERGFRILIIDACRNNLAVEKQAVRQLEGSRSVLIKRGLSPVTITSSWAGGGMLVAFATLSGDVASDGAGRNSPFTQALVKHLATPALELRRLFIRVRAEVVAATGGHQIPQVSDALNGEYVFKVGR
jgi:tetratricopeptide (TPR) repeat protein